MKELNLFIIWQSGEFCINRILTDIADQFDIKNIFSLHWKRIDICKRLNQLYPHRTFHLNSRKVNEIGSDAKGCRLYVVIVLDKNPLFVYGMNQNIIDFKKEERKKYNINYLHCADNQHEAYINIEVLIGISKQTFEMCSMSSTKFIYIDKRKKVRYQQYLPKKQFDKSPNFAGKSSTFSGIPCRLKEFFKYFIMYSYNFYLLKKIIINIIRWLFGTMKL